MLIFSGADVVLPGGVASSSSVIVEGDRVVDIRPGRQAPGPGDRHYDLAGHFVIPGFVDVHVHGLHGRDLLDGGDALAAIAGGLPRYGVTSFCPTTVACDPPALRAVLAGVRAMGADRPEASARVLPAHLESNFIHPDFRGAQPEEMLRAPAGGARSAGEAGAAATTAQDFGAGDILAVLADYRDEVSIVTVAPDIEGGLELVRDLAARGHRVSLGHSGARYDVGREAIAAGARQATHLFNRMPPLDHREPGLVGAVLGDERVAAEVICDARHVHPAMVKLVIAAKGPRRVMAITDGTAGSGLPDGARAILGGRPITVRDSAAYLDDGTLAGSALTFDGAFRVLVRTVRVTLAEAVRLCSTTPARELGLVDRGVVAPGLLADLVVLDADLRLRCTCIAGSVVYDRETQPAS
jgi:N-acetylglucosamine-6-phosphate deacetylase